MDPKTTFLTIKDKSKSLANIETLDLTLGCEFEFILLYITPDDEKPNIGFKDRDGKKKREELQGRRAENIVKQVLKEEFDVQCTDCFKTFKWKMELFDETKHDQPSTPAESARFWQVDMDAGTPPTYEEKVAGGFGNFTYVAMEMRTRKLSYYLPPVKTSAGNCIKHRITYDTEIQIVLDRLYQTLCQLPVDGLQPFTTTDGEVYEQKAGKQQKGYLYVNRHASYHTHIGCTKDEFSIETLKRLCSVMLVWEQQVDRLQAHNRITGYTLPTADREPPSENLRAFNLDANVYNKPLSYFFIEQAHRRRLAAGFPQAKYNANNEFRYDLTAWLALIKKQTTLEGLRSLYEIGHKECVLNLANLSVKGTDPTEKTQTIEFRQPIGTLNPAAELSFVDVVAKLVMCCYYISDKKFEELFEFQAAGYRATPLDSITVLKELQCKKEPIDYYESHTEGNSSTIARWNSMNTKANALKNKPGLLRALAEHVIENVRDQKSNFDPTIINNRINEKLLSGGYGQFSDLMLEKVLPPGTDAVTRAKLQIGYIAPR